MDDPRAAAYQHDQTDPLAPTGDPPRPDGIRASARAGLARSGTLALAVASKAVPLAARLVGVMNIYSWVVVASTVTIVGLVGVLTRPVTVGSVLPFLLLVAILAVPAVILRLFHGALVEVLAMPAWLRTSPELVRTHGAELAQLAVQAVDPTRDRLWSVPREIFRTGRLVMRASGDLPEYGRMVRLVSIPFLIAVLVSFLAGLVLIATASLLVIAVPLAVALQ